MEGSGGDNNSSKRNLPRVGVLIRQTLGGAKSTTSLAELEELKKRYQTMCQNLKALQKALKERHADLLSTAQSRVMLAESLSSLTEDGPLSKVAGKENGSKEGSSYYNIMVNVMDGRTKQRAAEFESFAMQYVAQWETTTLTRINADSKQVDNLCRDADHYQAKVDSLQFSIKKSRDTNKPVPAATTEKLERNQQKLQEAVALYNTAAQDLYTVMKEVVDRSWRDLHPLLLQLLKWDADVCAEETTRLASPMQQLKDTMVELARNEKIKPRLDRVADSSPAFLSTRPGGTANVRLVFGKMNENVEL